MSTSTEFRDFAVKSNLVGLTAPTLEAIQSGKKGFTVDRGKSFLAFQDRLNKELLNHRIIVDNRYTQWFRQGDLSAGQTKAFIIQFSVFSNLFLIAQLRKMLNADSVEGMRASKEILANEIGVIFRPTHKTEKNVQKPTGGYDQESDPELVSPEGTVEGGTFRFSAAHFEWLVRIAETLGLGFTDIGKRKHGTPPTLFFCDELSRLYGNEDYEISQAASYAVENWAAAGFWKDLIAGLEKFKKKHLPAMPLGFFTYHDRLEDQHAAHTQEELEEYYFENPEMDIDAFIKHGNEMLDGVAAFWDGLDEQRLKL